MRDTSADRRERLEATGVSYRAQSTTSLESRCRGGRAETRLPAVSPAKPPREDEERQLEQAPEKSRRLNPLETLLKVYTQTSGRTEARPDRQYPFFTGLPLKPYFDR